MIDVPRCRGGDFGRLGVVLLLESAWLRGVPAGLEDVCVGDWRASAVDRDSPPVVAGSGTATRRVSREPIWAGPSEVVAGLACRLVTDAKP